MAVREGRRPAVVMVLRRWTAPEGTEDIFVDLGNDWYGHRRGEYRADGTTKRGHWSVLARKRALETMERAMRYEMWPLPEGADTAVDHVPVHGVISIPGDTAEPGYSIFETVERTAAMRVAAMGRDLPRLELGGDPWTPSEPSCFHYRALEVLGASRAVLESGPEPTPVARTAPRRSAPRQRPAEPAAAQEGERDGYAPILGKGASRHIVLPDGRRHYLRKLQGSRLSDVELLRAAREHFDPVLLLGEAGVGKTEAVVAAYGADQIITLLGHEEVEAASLEGRYVPRPGGGWQEVVGKLVQAMREGKVLFIDEIALISSLVLSILYSAMDGRRELEPTMMPLLGTVRAEPGFYVCAATNPGERGARISSAMRSRFPLRPVITTDYRMAADQLGVPQTIASAAANLEERRSARELSWAPQLRELVQYRDAVERYGEDTALAALVGKAPDQDLRTVAEVVSRAVGRTVKPLST